MNIKDLKNKVVVITGSTGGLGQALACRLANAKAKLALLDLNEDSLILQVKNLEKISSVKAWKSDVCDVRNLENVMKEIADHFGSIDIVIANAGIGVIGGIENVASEDFARVIDVNLNGVYRTFRASLPYIIPSKGYMLAISSMAAFIHSPTQSSYTASKAGVWALVNSIRQELAPLGVSVGSLHPTFFETPMMQQVWSDAVGQALWKGNKKGIWKTVTIDEVVNSAVSAILHRKAKVTVPKSNNTIANAPGLFQVFIEKVGFDIKNLRVQIEKLRNY